MSMVNFFEHNCYLHARVPRINQSEGTVKTIVVPWARPGSGFTLLFEAFAMLLIEYEMPVNKVASTLVNIPHVRHHCLSTFRCIDKAFVLGSYILMGYDTDQKSKQYVSFFHLIKEGWFFCYQHLFSQQHPCVALRLSANQWSSLVL